MLPYVARHTTVATIARLRGKVLRNEKITITVIY